jgi:PadR family transcriptional regulator PadR
VKAKGAVRTECKAGHSAAQKPSRVTLVILRAMAAGPVYLYGFRLIERTGLPSGTVYPALRRLERDGLMQSHWEQQSIADAEQRPPRKYYKLTPSGRQHLGRGLEDSKSLTGPRD